jgi:hypothetical protein
MVQITLTGHTTMAVPSENLIRPVAVGWRGAARIPQATAQTAAPPMREIPGTSSSPEPKLRIRSVP